VYRLTTKKGGILGQPYLSEEAKIKKEIYAEEYIWEGE
jgi:hypothetical protein